MRAIAPTMALCVMLAAPCVAAGDGDAPVVIPHPKLMGKGEWDIRLSLSDEPRAALVVEPGHPKLKLGAEEINRYIVRHKGAPLPLCGPGREPAECATVIHLMPDAAELPSGVGQTETPMRHRSEQAYLIRHVSRENRRVVYLAGYGEQGGLYAAITFCHLLRSRDGAVWAYRADVDDYPDFRYRGDLSFGAGMTYAYLALHRNEQWGRSYLQTAHDYIDLGLHLKLNVMSAMISRYYTHESHNYLPGLIQYARERGIECSRGFGADFEGAKRQMPECKALFRGYLEETGRTEKDFMKLRGRHFCWSKDDLLRRFARLHAEAAQRDGATIMSFHFPDTGDENWPQRCDDCRKRFDDDRVKGDANVISVLHDEIHRAIPGAKFVAIVHPYSALYLDDPAYVTHFERLSKLIPEDVWLCVRETDRARIQRWYEATSRPAYIYFQPFSLPFRGMLAPVCRTAKTLHSPDRLRDMFALKGWDMEFWHIDMPLGAAYAWNAGSPGNAVVQKWDGSRFVAWEFDPQGRYDAALLGGLLPRVASFVWGREAGRLATEIYRSGLHPWMVYDPFRTENALSRIKSRDDSVAHLLPRLTSADFAFQAQTANRVRDLCLRIMNKEVPVERPILLLATTRLYKHAAMAAHIAPVWQHYYASKQAVADRKLELAQKELDSANEACVGLSEKVEQARLFAKGFPYVSRHVVTRRWPRVKHLIEKTLSEFRVPTLEELEMQTVSPRLYKEVTERVLRAPRVTTPPVIDGDVTDACWKTLCAPVRNFVRYPFVGRPHLATDQSIVKVCYDETNLYVAFRLLDAEADSIRSKERRHDDPEIMTDDVVEVIIAPAPPDKSFAQLVVNASGSRFDVFKRIKGRKKAVHIEDWNPEWQAKTALWRNGWTAEIAIPFAMFTTQPSDLIPGPAKSGDRWRINLAREKRTLELSAVKYMPNAGFRQTDKFAVLVYQ